MSNKRLNKYINESYIKDISALPFHSKLVDFLKGISLEECDRIRDIINKCLKGLSNTYGSIVVSKRPTIIRNRKYRAFSFMVQIDSNETEDVKRGAIYSRKVTQGLGRELDLFEKYCTGYKYKEYEGSITVVNDDYYRFINVTNTEKHEIGEKDILVAFDNCGYSFKDFKKPRGETYSRYLMAYSGRRVDKTKTGATFKICVYVPNKDDISMKDELLKINSNVATNTRGDSFVLGVFEYNSKKEQLQISYTNDSEYRYAWDFNVSNKSYDAFKYICALYKTVTPKDVDKVIDVLKSRFKIRCVWHDIWDTWD